VGITGTTRIFTILAHPSTHVAAPPVFNFIFDRLGLDMVYIAHDVPPGALSSAIDCYRSWANLGGFNVTVPHKEAAAQAMDKILPPADAIGAVNTAVRSADGLLTGYNTDGMGACKAIGDCSGARCLVLGAGGAARAITEGLISRGAAHVSILNRSQERAIALMALFPLEKTSLFMQDRLPSMDIVVQATPVADRVPFGLDLGALRKGTRVLETVMRETALSREALRHGLDLIPGHAMLLHQTTENFRLMTGRTPPDKIIREAFQSIGYGTP
jgi:shikimate dehydrogenase